MKRILLSVVASLAFTILSYAQVAPGFDIYAFPSRFDEKSEAYFDANGFTAKDIEIMTEGTIVSSTDHSNIDPESIKRWLDKYFPGSNSTGKVVLDWESGPYMDLRNYPKTDSRFKAAEAKMVELVTLVKKIRPNLEVTLYSLPFRTWNVWQKENYNTSGKFDYLISKLDFITPSLYILYTDEEVGRERNLQYLRDNLEPALAYGKQYNKPVIPFVWHRVHFNSPLYGKQIMRKETLASYIKYVKNYSYNSYKAEGITWWDGVGGRLDNLAGMDGHLNGTVYDAATYDAMIVNFAKHVKQVLNDDAAPEPAPAPAPAPAPEAQKVVSYTLFNADTKQEIATLADGAVLDLTALPTKNLNIRANTNPATVGSVVFSLSGAASKSVTENSAAYDLMGDEGAWVPAEGSYNLKATPYSASKGTGTAGIALSISFNVVKNISNPSPSDVTLTLVNADTDKDIMTLSSGATLDLSALPTKNLNIRANSPSGGVESVKFVMSGAQSKSVVESMAPHAMFGDDTKGDYYSWVPAIGSYSLQVTPYSGSKATGTAGATITTNFTVVNQAATSSDIILTLVNADSESDIMTLTSGATLDLSKLPTKSLNIRANTISSSVASVVLQLSGAETYKRTESGAPYTLKGDSNGDYNSWTPASGSYTLKVISYSGSKGTGTVLNTVSVSFKVVTGLSTSSSSSATAGSEVTPIASGLSVYPNPATTQINVEASDAGEGSATIRMYDLNGQVMLTQQENTTAGGLKTVVNISKLRQGLYILEVVTPKGRTSQRIIVE